MLVPPEYGVPVNLVCPPDGNVESQIWGTDIYAPNSSICVAAVHAGVITLEVGGKVTVTKMPGQETLAASTRHGVSSLSGTGWNWRDYPDPFRVTPYAITANVPTAPGARSGPLPGNTDLSRTIRLAGITATGTSATVAPRTISLPGITARGDFQTVASRTMTLAGFNGSGAPAVVASRTMTLAGFTGTGRTVVNSQTIALKGFSGSGSTVVRSRSIALSGWTGQGSTNLP